MLVVDIAADIVIDGAGLDWIDIGTAGLPGSDVTDMADDAT